MWAMKAAGMLCVALFATGARASEGVLVYRANGARAPIGRVAEALKRALRDGGRVVVDGALDRAAKLEAARARVALLPPAHAAAGEPHKLVVITEPPGAEVVLDGRAAGEAPVTLTVPAGDHVVEAHAKGRFSDGAELHTTGDLEARLELPADPTAALLDGLRTRPDRAGLNALAATAKLDGVVVAAAARDGAALVIAAQRFDGAHGAATRVAVVRTTGPLDAAAVALWKKLDGAEAANDVTVLDHPALAVAPALAIEPAPSVLDTLRPAKSKWYLSPYLWGAASLVGLGATVLIGELDTPPPLQGAVTIDSSAFAGRGSMAR